MILRFVCHCRKWNEWRKLSRDHWLYKIHVFFHPKTSPTFCFYISDKERAEIHEAFMKSLSEEIARRQTMTLDEAIKHCEEKAAELREYSDVLSETSTTPKGKEISDCLECAEEHEQLAEWLKELKGLRSAVSLLKFNIHALNELIKEADNDI